MESRNLCRASLLRTAFAWGLSLFGSCGALLVGNLSFAQGWKAGTAQVCITPAEPMPMAGYSSRGSKHAEGTLHDLWAKVLVLQDAQGRSAALITLDLVGIGQEFSQSLCEQIQQEQGWERSQIALCCSHTHTGPVVGKNLQPLHALQFSPENRELVARYATRLQRDIADAVQRARDDLEPVELAWGLGRTDFAVNRRENREADVPKLRSAGELKGPTDHDVPVLAVRRQGQLKSVVLGYACHNTTLSIMQWSGDYAGFAQIDLQKAFPGSQAMFWSGCGADQNPLPRRTVELAQGYGSQLAEAVASVVKGSMHSIAPALRTVYRTVALPFDTLPTQEKLQQDSNSTNAYEAARAKMLLAQVQAGESLSPTYPYPVEIWELGTDVAWVFLGGEVVVDYSLAIKEHWQGERNPQVWCAGYANDVMAYIPSKRVLLEGGYEGQGAMVYYGLPASWSPAVEEVILGAVQELSAR